MNPDPAIADATRALRILIADDHGVVREGAQLMIAREPGCKVCGVATNGREAIEKAIELCPDVIVLDLHMPEFGGLEAVRELRRCVPSAELVIFSGETSERLIDALFEAGVKSFIRKVEAPRLLIAAIRSAGQHKPFFTPEISHILFSRFTGDRGSLGAGSKLTTRELQIVRLVAEGKSNKETAEALGISTRTTETHRASLMRKLGVSSTAEVVRYAIRNGIVKA